MASIHGTGKRRFLWGALWVGLIFLAAVGMMDSFPAAKRDTPSATYSHGRLSVAIPYHAVAAGAGYLTLELLDPEDRTLAQVTRYARVSEGKGSWQRDLRLEKPLPVEDLVWHRLRYRFEYDSGDGGPLEGIESVSQILRTPVIHILGQQSYLAGSQAAVRVVATDSKNDVLEGGALRIELLKDGDAPRVLFEGPLGRRGTTEARFRFPAGLVGNFNLRYSADTPIGAAEFTQGVRLEEKQSILLTTEKPLYQPGQAIHVRALVFDRLDHIPAKDRKLTFAVEDSRGNKVFKHRTKTDEFGIAFAEFRLADEVNLGTYHIRALVGGDEAASTSTAELAVNVERYVLPKFKVAIDLGGEGGKAKRGYRPGDRVSGTVRAHYFFGKPVGGAEIALKASSLDVARFEVESIKGKTDKEGNFKFDFRLPDFFAGRPLDQGAAKVLIEATVHDAAGHAETRGEPITVSEAPILITAIPEGGAYVPNLENEVFVLTSYADGSPARAEIMVRGAGSGEQRVSSDAGGVAVVKIESRASAPTLDIEARDSEGNFARRKVELETRDGQDQILLRTQRAVYRVGERMRLTILSTRHRGAAYIDVIKAGQTILTRDVDIENGKAELALTVTPELAGTVDLNAYQFSQNAQPVGDHRLVFVQPAEELRIEAIADSPVYRPGQDARIRFRVTNSRGEGVRAALGLQVVDEAVFALAEKQPGFAKVFFYLEQEILKPRYEIHSIGMPEIVEPSEKEANEQHDRAARALFAATELVRTTTVHTEFGRTIPSTKYAEYAKRYQAVLKEQGQALAKKFSHAYLVDPQAGELLSVMKKLLRIGEITPAELRDAWGSELRVEPVTWDASANYYMVLSSGPDKQPGTGDDLGVYLERRHRNIVGPPRNLGQSTLQIEIEPARGPFTARGEIIGSVADQTGAAVKGAAVTVRALPDGKRRNTRSDDRGRFSLRGLPPGNYELSVTMPGFESVSTKNLELRSRDRAVLSVLLKGEAAEDIVVVNESLGVFQAGAINRMVMEDREAGEGGGFGFGRADAFRGLPEKAAFDQRMRNEAALPAAAPMSTATLAKDESSSAPRVRSYFPEALYINPEIITDRNGRASIVIPLADSITMWRMAMLASTESGALGSATSSLKVFQDFFVDLDLPVTLTQGDQVTVPVAVYNYSGAQGDVRLELKPEKWFTLAGDDYEKAVQVEADRVGSSEFTVVAQRIGKFKLTLSARMSGGEDRADIVVREIEVVPNGREQNLVYNGRLEGNLQQRIVFPAAAIPEASKIFIRLYPGPLSQVIEGMDSILRMPGGCFEQTSSSTYPNVLALDYMKRTKKLTPEIHAKAEGFIANGYQRLLTFEVPGGGFSWFGNPPANKILTAYGLMEFYDMSQVYEVDPNLISRTQQWLADQQTKDGSWEPDRQFINEGATNRYNSDVLRITAYLAWSLGNTGYRGPAVERAKEYIEPNLRGKLDSYTLAVLGNFAVDHGKDREFTRETMSRLLEARTEAEEMAYWDAQETAVYATGESAAIETTGLAVQALLKWGEAPNTARKALAYLASKKNAAGHWGTTQATIMALRALLLSTSEGAADVRGEVEILVNGKPVQTLTLDEENNDLLHQFVFKQVEQKG
ncbi:MAG TPA: MG2 domain-containing protein, partial [Terriglobia bacterium]|nr:MG2 domain-containing protein [Terriglobia bacterium]